MFTLSVLDAGITFLSELCRPGSVTPSTQAGGGREVVLEEGLRRRW